MWLPQGFGSLPNSLPRLRETPYTTYYVVVFPGIHVSTVPLDPARAGIPFTYGWFQLTFRNLTLNIYNLPARAHNSAYNCPRPLAPFPVHLVIILHFGITLFTLYRSVTYNTPLQDYKAVSPDNTQLYIFYITRLLLLRVHVWLPSPTCHRRRPPPVRRESPTMITRGCHGKLGPLSVAHKYNTPTPISTISEYIYITSPDRYTDMQCCNIK